MDIPDSFDRLTLFLEYAFPPPPTIRNKFRGVPTMLDAAWVACLVTGISVGIEFHRRFQTEAQAFDALLTEMTTQPKISDLAARVIAAIVRGDDTRVLPPDLTN